VSVDPVQLEAERLRRVIARRIGNLVNLLRVSRGDLAAAVGCTETKISRVIKESSDLSAVELALAARFLKVPVGVLTGELSPDENLLRKR
jgi:transcriptional regulator with XRE-family HTH domain